MISSLNSRVTADVNVNTNGDVGRDSNGNDEKGVSSIEGDFLPGKEKSHTGEDDSNSNAMDIVTDSHNASNKYDSYAQDEEVADYDPFEYDV